MAADKKQFDILVIEDNPADFALVEEFLSEQIQSLTLVNARNFRDAISILLAPASQFDIIILDLSLPDKTGIPLIREIVAASSNAPIIVLTSYSDLSFGVSSLSLGIADYLLKEELTSIWLYKSILYSLERKRAIAALEDSERKYSELFHLSPLPMFVFDAHTLNFLDANNSFIKHYGYCREELLQMNLKNIQPTEEIPVLEKALFHNNQNSENTSWGIFRHLKKNGDIIYVDIQSNFIDYKGKKAKVTIASDVTERLNYIKEIELQNQKLRDISWMQSHMVRAPVARIMGLIQILKDSGSCGEEKDHMLEYILMSAHELDHVIREITAKTRVIGDDTNAVAEKLAS